MYKRQGLSRAATGVRVPVMETSRGVRFEPLQESQRRPQVELVRTQVKRDGTTGLPIDAITDSFMPPMPSSFSGALRRNVDAAPMAAELPKDDYLDIPSFLRRQAD